MSSAMGTIIPIAGAVVGGIASGGNPAGIMAGYSIGSGISGGLGGSGKTTPTSNNPLTPSMVTGPGFGDFTTHPDALDKTWDAPQVNAQMTPTTNAAESASVPGSGSKSPGGTGSMGAGDYLSLGSTAMQAIAAAKAREQQKELTDAEIWKLKNPLAGQVVQGPNPSMVGTNMGGFPSVGGGFVRY